MINRFKVSAVCALLFLTLVPVQADSSPLVEVQKVDPSIYVELKYKTADNFMNEVLYDADFRCFLRPEVAQRVARVQAHLRGQGYGLKIFDGYRPLSVQKRMFARFPQPGFVADPKKGSNHNRGAAVDLTLVDLEGNQLPMPSEYDEFSERAHIEYQGGSVQERKNRKILQQAMTQEGFRPLRSEWWHFDDPKAKTYAVLDILPS